MTTPAEHLEDVLAQPQVDDGPPLGRHVVHDRRSRDYPVRTLVPRTARRPVLWRPRTGPLDQGKDLRYRGQLYRGGLGACTGMAAAKAVSCRQTLPAGGTTRGRQLREPTALRLYSRATDLDPFPGSWPSTDTGSSSLAIAKATVEAGLASAYLHAFGVEQVLDALQFGPVITGTWWLSGLDHPDSSGRVRPTGHRRGGHEYVINAWDGVPGSDGLLGFVQSWGPAWGDRGAFAMTVGDYAGLLADQGDATRLVPA